MQISDGSNDVTASVKKGTYGLTLASGGAKVLRYTIAVDSGKSGTLHHFDIAAWRKNRSTVRDTVRATVRVKSLPNAELPKTTVVAPVEVANRKENFPSQV